MDETEVETVIRLRAVDVRDLFPDFSSEDAGSRVCLLCATKLKDKTHNLTRHLERHHVGALLQLMEQRTAASLTAVAAATAVRTLKATGAATGSVSTASASSRTRKQQQQQPAQESPPLQQQQQSKGHSKSSKGHKQRRVSSTHADAIGDGKMAPVDEMKAEQAESAKLALVNWLTHEQLPMSLVANEGFRQFVQSLNASFEPPEYAELQQVLESVHARHREDVEKENRRQQQGKSGVVDGEDGEQDASSSRREKKQRVARKSVIETLALVAVARTRDDAPLVRYQQLPCGVLESGFAQVRVQLALASRGDALACRGLVKGKQGVLGRAFVGIVEQIHDRASTVKEQQRVALVSPRVACDTCLALALSSDDGASSLSCTHSTQYFGVSSSRGALSEYIVVPTASLHVLPDGIPDDLALLVDDLALVLRTSDVVKQRRMEKVAIVSDGVPGCTIALLTRHVSQTLGLAQGDIHIFATRSIGRQQQTQLRQHATLTTLDVSDPSALDDVLSEQLAFGGVVDLCGTEASAEFAISLVQPMGTLIFVDRGRFEAVPRGDDSSTSKTNGVLAMDMNAIVVNELEMVSICDCSAQVPAAVAYLAEQAKTSERRDELRAFLSSPVALGDVLGELCRPSAVEALEAQYLQVDCRVRG